MPANQSADFLGDPSCVLASRSASQQAADFPANQLADLLAIYIRFLNGLRLGMQL